ncbi:hypothetical protein EJ08DRAFT_24944 [Tothia fuscella]|uniref:Tyrosine specific protein phosphatases domain-containing protein n=1 Tax=Tothia fuscella TaxID=1048955 RepID=A0A9P4NGR8_9PEZI|nr:hypothetical protein EJ08DRAFT_24944 [Tothia fuscella]
MTELPHIAVRSDIPTEVTLKNNSQPTLPQIASTSIFHAIPDNVLADALTTPPFVPIPGALNLRDLGLLTPSTVKPGLIYRSGALHTLPPSSTPFLKSQLHLRKIYDFRSENERAKGPDPEVEGVKNICLNYTEKPSRAVPGDFKLNGGVDAYVKMYDDVLRVHAQSYKTVLMHLRDRPGEAVLFHCSAGKDRTGILSAIILSLAGQTREVIAYDYILTRIGIESEREMLTENLKVWLGDDAMEQDGVFELSSSNAANMLAFLKFMDEKYGGPVGWCRSILGFGDEDLDVIRRNICV